MIRATRSLMLHKCANPACTEVFRYLREGKMFYVETEVFGSSDPDITQKRRGSRRLEHYWLCDECSSHVTLAFDQHQGLLTVPLPDGIGKKTIRMMAPERIRA
jgi:hypothetical protein